MKYLRKFNESNEHIVTRVLLVGGEDYEFGDIDPKFVKFIKNIQDYEMSKDRNFYLETEKIPV